MDALTLSLDHVGLAVKYLATAKNAYQKLGFNLTALSMHAGANDTDGKIVPWGSGNHCAMFAQGYFEIIGLMDAALPSNVKKMVERYEGLHIVAMRCSRAEDAYPALIHAGVPPSSPWRWKGMRPLASIMTSLAGPGSAIFIWIPTDIKKRVLSLSSTARPRSYGNLTF